MVDHDREANGQALVNLKEHMERENEILRSGALWYTQNELSPSKNLGSAWPLIFWHKSLGMGTWSWEIVIKVVPINVPGLQDPPCELLDRTKLGPFWS